MKVWKLIYQIKTRRRMRQTIRARKLEIENMQYERACRDLYEYEREKAEQFEQKYRKLDHDYQHLLHASEALFSTAVRMAASREDADKLNECVHGYLEDMDPSYKDTETWGFVAVYAADRREEALRDKPAPTVTV